MISRRLILRLLGFATVAAPAVAAAAVEAPAYGFGQTSALSGYLLKPGDMFAFDCPNAVRSTLGLNPVLPTGKVLNVGDIIELKTKWANGEYAVSSAALPYHAELMVG